MKVVSLHPDKPHAVTPNTSDQLADMLEGIAGELRKGESTAQYAAFVYLNGNSRVSVRTLGDQTCHQQIGMLAIALHMAQMDLHNMPE
jgi:hypothetical protein